MPDEYEERFRQHEEMLQGLARVWHDQGYVSRLERGEVTDITVRTLARLADALRVSTDYLLGRSTREDEEDADDHATYQRTRKAAPVG